MDTVQRSRTPAVVLTQVFAHDLHLFVTVQLLDETPAVLSPGMSGSAVKKPRLDKDGKSIICKTDNFVPLVVSRVIHHTSKQFVFSIAITGLVEKRGRNSIQETGASCFKFIFRFSRAKWRNSMQETGAITTTQKRNKKRDDKKNPNDPLADLPEFKENLLDTELPAFAHISQESDLERPTKVATKLWKHSIYTHFLKDQNFDVWLRTKMTRALCRRRTGESLPPAEITVDHKVLNGEGGSRNNHRYKSVRKFLEPSQKPKVIYTDNSFEFCKILWRSVMESSNLNTSSIRDKWHCWKSRTTSKGRYVSSSATVSTGWKMVGWFYGMFFKSAMAVSWSRVELGKEIF